jgi:hypothetical protein
MLGTGNDHGAMRVTAVTVWLAVLAVLGVAGYDAFGIMSAHVSGENDAQNAAYDASQAWHNDHGSITSAYQAAVASVAGKHERVLTKDFTVDPDGTVHLLLRIRAHTVVAQRIPPLKKDTIVTVHGDANSVS